MKKVLVLMLILGTISFLNAEDGFPDGSSSKVESESSANDFFLDEDVDDEKKIHLKKGQEIIVSVTGQGVAPTYAVSPAQSYALAKRAAIADAYRLIAEKVKGVSVEGQDTVQNMMLKRSTVRTLVTAMVRNAQIVETTYKEGLCEVEMEIKLSYAQFN